jgi:hypothetical protein
MSQDQAAPGTPALPPRSHAKSAARTRWRPRRWLLISGAAVIVAWVAILYLPLYLPRREFNGSRYLQIAHGMSEARVEELLGGRANAARPPDELAWLRKTKAAAGSSKFWVFDGGQSLTVVAVDFDGSDRVTSKQVFFCWKRSPWQKLRSAFGL